VLVQPEISQRAGAIAYHGGNRSSKNTFDNISGEEDWNPSYSIGPTQPAPIIRQHPKDPRREFSLVRWGLFPQRRKMPLTLRWWSTQEVRRLSQHSAMRWQVAGVVEWRSLVRKWVYLPRLGSTHCKQWPVPSHSAGGKSESPVRVRRFPPGLGWPPTANESCLNL